jgi:hypothetical protein
VTCGAGPPLQQRPPDREARIARIIEVGQKLHHLAAVEKLGIDAVEPHDVAASRQHVEADRPMRHDDLAALRQHDIEVERMREAFPQLEREFEKLGVAVDHVIRAHDRGVAPDIA